MPAKRTSYAPPLRPLSRRGKRDEAKLSFGTVSAPGQRYYPAVLAQAAATLAEMYAGRFWLALGSGEALNEHITGGAWPDKPRRLRRVRESVDVMRARFAGETEPELRKVVDQFRAGGGEGKPMFLQACALIRCDRSRGPRERVR